MVHRSGTDSIGSLAKIAAINGAIPPTLYFVDLFGYRVISLDLITRLIQPFGCDCIFFEFEAGECRIRGPSKEAAAGRNLRVAASDADGQ